VNHDDNIKSIALLLTHTNCRGLLQSQSIQLKEGFPFGSAQTHLKAVLFGAPGDQNV